jgi:hypothetical protein
LFSACLRYHSDLNVNTKTGNALYTLRGEEVILTMCYKVLFFVLFVSHVCYSAMEEEGVKYANRCEGNVV